MSSNLNCQTNGKEASPTINKPIIRFIRTYGEKGEVEPPIVVINDERTTTNAGLSSNRIVIEFDVFATVPPNLFAKFYHCSFDWQEDENIFINDVTSNRTSNVFWESAPLSSKYYNFRGKILVPNEQVKFKYSGNWKVKLFDYAEPEEPLAESRFFVINSVLNTELRFYSDFYKPERNVTASAFNIEVVVSEVKPSKIVENLLHTVAIYRNHRWFEPYFISQYSLPVSFGSSLKFSTSIYGILSGGKVFRIDGVPAENGYRVLDLTNLSLFPSMNIPLRLPLSDYRRRGSYLDPHDDGSMITRFVSPSYDEYIYIEFTLDPEGWETSKDVFLVGSFNNWHPSREWQLFYDDDERLYKLRQWVRRGRHNYLYATGKYDDTGNIVGITFEEFEGNTVTSGHTFLAFVYYRNPSFGGFDEIVGFARGNYFTSGR
ncbi:MAG: type IX secretion system plug protein domain-containing protein [Candidatus Kapaibacteriota bacterium]